VFALRRDPPAAKEQGHSRDAADASAREERLIEAFESLVRSKLGSKAPFDGRLGAAWDSIVKLVREANTRNLRAIAELGAQTGETAINIGWVYHDFREVAESTGKISSAVEEVVSSIGDLSSSSLASATQAENSRDTMRSCIDDSRHAIEAMKVLQEQSTQVGQRLASLQAAVDKIGNMAGTIDAVARQTNLLALNATIEAARAGEAGRGFAVVAAEVKVLSVETGKATQQIRASVAALTSEMKEITGAVKESLKSVNTGTATVTQVSTIMEGVGDEVSEVAERVRGLSDLLEKQRTAMSEISENVTRISEKANKTKDEIGAIGGRLKDCELTVSSAFDASSGTPVANPGLVRFAADATAWKRRLSSILLATDPVPGSPPVLEASTALADAERLGAADAADRSVAAELAEAVRQAQQGAAQMIAGVSKSDWGAATPAYIACDEALKKAVAAASKLMGSAGGGR
jgi:ABC-type transporter Mla subunit MlaD